ASRSPNCCFGDVWPGYAHAVPRQDTAVVHFVRSLDARIAGGARAVLERAGMFARSGWSSHLVVTGVRSEEHTSELQSRENLVCLCLHSFPTRRSSDLASRSPNCCFGDVWPGYAHAVPRQDTAVVHFVRSLDARIAGGARAVLERAGMFARSGWSSHLVVTGV